MTEQRLMLLDKRPECDQQGCGKPATHGVVWLKQQYYCEEHTTRVLGIADAMGYPTPKATIAAIFVLEEDNA